MIKVSISIVLYEHNIEEISTLLSDLYRQNTPIDIYIIDNSPMDNLRRLIELYPNIYYEHHPENPGFGAGHNIVLRKVIEKSMNYHFVVNPDIFVNNTNLISEILVYLEKNKDVGMLMPQILNLDGTLQYLPKLLPSPFSILLRKLKKPKFLYEPFIREYELRDVPANMVYSAPILSGCFTAFRVEALQDIGLYDDRFFMYFEDWDLSRRMHRRYKTIYFPKVSVFHGYDSGANKSKHLFKIFVKSAISYFDKWGWFFDFERKKVNKKTLEQFK